jgi:hypothetical protein
MKGNMKGYESKTFSSITQFVFKNMTMAKGRLGEKIAAELLCCNQFLWPI